MNPKQKKFLWIAGIVLAVRQSAGRLAGHGTPARPWHVQAQAGAWEILGIPRAAVHADDAAGHSSRQPESLPRPDES
jgi:hypothetical protein